MRQSLLGAGVLVLGAGVACAQPGPRLQFATTSIPVGRGPNDVAIGDVNRDGHPDILTANIGGRSVACLLGDGRGAFRPAPWSPLALPIAPHLVVLGDFNGRDGPEIAVTGHDSNDVIVIDLGTTVRPLHAVKAIEGIEPHNHGLAAADVDGDGALDLATSNNNGNSVSVLVGDGRGAFRPAPGSPFRVGRAPYPLTVADLDGDRDPDVMTPDVNGHTVSVLLGNGRGSFEPAPGAPYRVGERPFFVTSADVNGDRAPDLVVSHDDSDQLSILVNEGKGRFGDPRRVDMGGRTWKVRVADADGDGRNDLIMGRAPSSVVILLGDGRGAFRPAPGSPFPVGRGPWGIAVGDLNRDGRVDVVTTESEGEHVSVLLSRGGRKGGNR